MSGMNSESDGTLNLGANLSLGFLGLQVAGCQDSLSPQISGWIDEACDFVAWRDRTPTIHFPFTREGEVQTQIGVRMFLCVGSDFSEPGARHHDAGGSYGILVKRVEAGSVHGMGDGEIVGVDDKKFRVGRIAQALGNGLVIIHADDRSEEHTSE